MLTSLNEVGGDPNKFGIPKSEFLEINARRAKEWNLAMTGTSTHDTKRSEDVRARINILSEIPEIWKEFSAKFSKLAEKHKTHVTGIGKVPEANEEYFIYQTLVGAWELGTKTASKNFHVISS